MDIQPVFVLIDDSQSMKLRANLQSPASKTVKMLESLRSECQKTGCKLKVNKLSELSPLVRKGYTPLNESLADWLDKTGNEAWILFSDGGDYQPSVPWSQELKNLGKKDYASKKEEKPASRGMIVAFSQPGGENTWLESVDLPPFAFEGKPVFSEALVTLETPASKDLRIQVQATLDNEILASDNAYFAPGDTIARVSLPVSSLPRGRHLITYKALATADEKVFWDNEIHKYIEVLPNTVGVLHLLGSPSWDGRYLRRFLKSEPKYDLISFFILRDPWDSQGSNERELSLIPFPVARLFNEELPNFRVIILQNFTLLQFLMPEYQKNLVKFVKEGGGLLFLGGHRSLLDTDMNNSPLKEILPFTSKSRARAAGNILFPLMGDMQRKQVNKQGPWFEKDLPFRIAMARPEMAKRALANVYDDWEALLTPLSSLDELRGLHHMENVVFKPDASTPLLNAIHPDGSTSPLAIASYPDKGRAIWLFSDSLWRLGNTSNPVISREVYHRFFQSAMTWLLRQDIRHPLIASEFRLSRSRTGQARWSATLKGAAVPYFKADENWSFQVCGVVVSQKDLLIDKPGNQSLNIAGVLGVSLQGGDRCDLQITGEHPAFGSVRASLTTIFPKIYPDKEVGSSAQKLARLATLTGAGIVKNPSGLEKPILRWMEKNNHGEGIVLPRRYKTHPDHFWIFDSIWIWLLLLFIPLEVLCRRWHLLTTRG